MPLWASKHWSLFLLLTEKITFAAVKHKLLSKRSKLGKVIITKVIVLRVKNQRGIEVKAFQEISKEARGPMMATITEQRLTDLRTKTLQEGMNSMRHRDKKVQK